MKLRLTSSLVGAVTSESLGVFLYMKKIGIYKITNPIGESYIGQAIDIEKRWQQHRNANQWKYYKLHNSFIKYGTDNHTFEVQKECLREDLNKLERYYQEEFDVVENGLNHVYQEADEKPKILSEETKRKISESCKGRTGTMKGRKHSEETKRKIKESCKNPSEEIRRKISETHKGKSKGPMSEETKRKISETLSGRTTGRRGEEHSEETKRKISETMKGRKLSEETKRRKSEAMKKYWDNKKRNKVAIDK